MDSLSVVSLGERGLAGQPLVPDDFGTAWLICRLFEVDLALEFDSVAFWRLRIDVLIRIYGASTGI